MESRRRLRRVEKGGGQLRAGATALSLFTNPLNVDVLHALEDGPQSLGHLNRAVGHPPATTMRAYLKRLAEMGALERRQEPGFAGSAAYSLTDPGRQLLSVGSTLESWLAAAPDGPIPLGGPAARSAIKALVEGWNSTLVRVLAARALTLTELARLISAISYPTLERRLAAMRRTGQLQARRSDGAARGTPYGAALWLRQAAAPLVAAVAWERAAAPDRTRAPSRIDIEALFLLTVPLLELEEDLSGRCRLAVEVRADAQLEYAGAMVRVEEGRPVSVTSSIDGDSDAWTSAGIGGWLAWMTNGEEMLEFGGEKIFARGVCEALRDALTPRLAAGAGPPASARR